jgi:hypothetical protein
MKAANKILHHVPIHIREPFIKACFSSSNRSYIEKLDSSNASQAICGRLMDFSELTFARQGAHGGGIRE